MGEGLLTLGVDTSTERRSVVLQRDELVLAGAESELREGGSAGLLADVDRVLRSAGVGLREVGLFAAAVGPGSFTGLRSGLATVKGLALTLGRPVVGTPTLHAVAHQARPARRLVALIPAGRGEVFAQLLEATGDGRVVELESPEHIPPERLLEKISRLGGGVKWAGSGAVKFREMIREGASAAGVGFRLTSDEASEGDWLLSDSEGALAGSVAALARARFAEGGEWGAEALGAIYVRPSDAELKGAWRAQG